MNISIIEKINQVISVLITWGGYIMLYALITIIIGAVLLVTIDIIIENGIKKDIVESKRRKFLHNTEF